MYPTEQQQKLQASIATARRKVRRCTDTARKVKLMQDVQKLEAQLTRLQSS